jgi:MFS family permease
VYSQAYRRYVTGLFLTIYLFAQIDRQAFSILMEPIKRELSLSDSQLGFLAGPALVLFYATLGIPVARWADRSHRVNIMTGAIALWSAIVAVSTVVHSFCQFAIARIGVGVGEAGFSAVAQSVIADYHPAAQRARALSIFMLGIPLGGALSAFVGGWITETWGWRAVFIAAGVPGLLLALLLKGTVSEPARLQRPDVARSNPLLRTVFGTVWRRPALRHLAAAAALSNLVAGGVMGWNPSFFARLHDMSTGELGTWLAFNGGVGGGLGIWLSGRLSASRYLKDERQQARLLAGAASLAWLVLLGMLLLPTKAPALGFSFLANVFLSFFYAPCFALVQTLTASSMRATVIAIVIFLQILCAGVVGLQLTGMLSDALAGSLGDQALRWAMIAMTPTALWAAAHFWLAARTIREDVQEAAAENV